MSGKKKQEQFDVSQVLDGFNADFDDELLAEHSKTFRPFVEANDKGRYGSHYGSKLKDLDGGKELAARKPEQLASLVGSLVYHLDRIDRIARKFRALDPGNINVHHVKGWYAIWGPRSILMISLRDILRKKLPLADAQIMLIANWVAAADNVNKHTYPLSGIVKAMENANSTGPLEGDARTSVEKMLANIKREWDQKSLRTFVERLEAVLGTAPEVPLEPGEAWSDAALADLEAIQPEKQAAVIELLNHCQSASQGKPSAKWLKTAESLMEAVGDDLVTEYLTRWFPLVDKPRTNVIESWSEWVPNPNLMISDVHADILKGLVWCSSLLDGSTIARVLTTLAITAYRKVPGIGPRAVRIGNACVYSLGAIPGMEGVAQLAILKVRVKFGTAQKGIEKALIATAERVGIPREELEEMSVPAYGLPDVGVRTELLGDFTAKLVVSGRKPELQWFKSDGKQQKSVPAAVKANFADDLKELKQVAKDIEKMLPAQVARIEQVYLQQKQWTHDVWAERYLNHPLIGTLARRLIWNFQLGEKHVSAIWTSDGFVDSKNEAVDVSGKGTTVRLWHPLDENDVDKLTAWRDWLHEHEVQQPFKQAYREVYLLTDAERNTQVYSNRFAAHVLKQHQFNALCGARGWKNTLRLLVDDNFPPTRLQLTSWNLRAEFWVEGAGEDYGTDTNETGTFYYLTTDQVRFYRSDAATNWAHASGGGYGSAGTDRVDNQPLALEQIPALAFSEVMRDVDLFVGVASVGNDPNWNDGGPEGRYRDYWHSYSFGELGATAATRKTVLERLIPRLKIADRCSFEDRFLIVRGDVRTYRIHLGSGNILVEPYDEYLCIVPKQSAGKSSGGLFLPFEGDGTMSIILSKALLLADDTKIKDATILSQIKR